MFSAGDVHPVAVEDQMMSRVKMLLAATFLGGAVMAGSGALAQAPFGGPIGGPDGRPVGPGAIHPPGHGGLSINSAEFDPAQLPEFKGKVAQYTLSPRGSVDGLVLDDGTEVQVSPALSTALVFSVKPGDTVSIRGLKARAIPLVSAVTVTNTASGAVVGGSVDAHHPWDGPRLEVSGKVKILLHSPRGEVDGVLLEDGTSVRMPPHAARKFADLLKPGSTIAVRGFGTTSPLGKAVGAREIGPSLDKLTRVEFPHPGFGHDGGRRLHDAAHAAPDGATTPTAPAPK
jgi:hypothetical protein